MIDPNKCEYEESYYDTDSDFPHAVHYFTYPKDMDECNFETEENYGNVVSMCISLTVYENGESDIAMSPTVEDGNSLLDVDWRNLYEGINYTSETPVQLLRKIK